MTKEELKRKYHGHTVTVSYPIRLGGEKTHQNRMFFYRRVKNWDYKLH